MKEDSDRERESDFVEEIVHENNKIGEETKVREKAIKMIESLCTLMMSLWPND